MRQSQQRLVTNPELSEKLPAHTWQELHVWLGIVTRTQGWTFRNPAETTPKRGCWRTEYFVKNKPRRNPEVQRTDTIEELPVVVCRESQLFDVYRVYSYSSRYRYQRLSIYVACVSRSVHVANIYIGSLTRNNNALLVDTMASPLGMHPVWYVTTARNPERSRHRKNRQMYV